MTTTLPEHVARSHELAEKFIAFLETGEVPAGLMAPNVFCDFSMPTWRLQATGVDGAAALRRGGHPGRSAVSRWRFDPTPTGFVLEFEERWTAGGQEWYCREMVRADISEAGITELSIYCTGDWDEAQVARHRAEVALLRP